MTLLLVMLGAAVGAPSRWLLDQKIQSRHDSVLPWGTLTINVAGSLLLGIVMGAAALGYGSPGLLALVGTGFCGGFTTFSTFAYETVRLVQQGSTLEAAINVAASLVLGMVAALAGWHLTQALWA